jgi:Tol biopolymer transport system component
LTLVYEQGYEPSGVLWTTIRDTPYGDFMGGSQNVVGITNLWDCDPDAEESNLNCSGQEMTMPRFSPDGRTIYFIGQRILAPDDSTRGIYSVPTEGGEATRIPIENSDGTPASIGTFALSHDGSTFAFSHKPADENVGIFTAPIGGGVPNRVTDQGCRFGAHSPSFSPDDRMIVFTSGIYSGDNCTGTAHTTIYTTPVDNGGTSPGTPLFPEDATDTRTITKYYPTYSPDGKYIAFGNHLSNVWRLATAPATGGNVTAIDDAPCVGCVPLWLEKPLDTTITSITSRRSGDSITSSVAFSSIDNEATFECKLDNGDFEVCTSPKEYPDLLEASSHTVEVRAVDSVGNTDPTPARRTWTVDTTGPTVVGVSPKNREVAVPSTDNITATFSENIDGNTLWQTSIDKFTLTKQGSSGSVVLGSPGYNSITHEATFYPASNLEANTTYTATIKGGDTGVKDLAGNALERDYSWTFTTGPPTVESYTPTQTTGVPRNTKPTATFFTDMKASTITASNIQLQVYNKLKKRWVNVAHAVSYDEPRRTATVTPSSTLAASRKYRVTVTTNVQSSTGIALDQNATTSGNQPKVWTFTTR